MAFDFERIRDILVCPACRGELVCDGETLISVNADCRLSFPIADDIPRLLVDDATTLTEQDWSAAMQRQGRNAETGEPVEHS